MQYRDPNLLPPAARRWMRYYSPIQPTPAPPDAGPVSITCVETLPMSPYNGTGIAGIIITNGLSSYFKVTGYNLGRIVSVTWYPKNIDNVKFSIRPFTLISEELATFGINMLDNYLDPNDRGGYLSFVLDDSTTMVYPVKTFGKLSVYPLWTASDQGLITG
jgi:hypothetical protein